MHTQAVAALMLAVSSLGYHNFTLGTWRSRLRTRSCRGSPRPWPGSCCWGCCSQGWSGCSWTWLSPQRWIHLQSRRCCFRIPVSPKLTRTCSRHSGYPGCSSSCSWNRCGSWEVRRWLRVLSGWPWFRFRSHCRSRHLLPSPGTPPGSGAGALPLGPLPRHSLDALVLQSILRSRPTPLRTESETIF